MNKTRMLLLSVMSLVLMVSAADHSMIRSNAGGKSAFINGDDWDDGQPPIASNNYYTAGFTMRTPDNALANEVYVFAGDSLTINGGTLAMKCTGKCVVNNLIVDGGTLGHWRDSALCRLYGNAWINAGKNWTIEAGGDNFRNFDIYSQISGPGNLIVRMGLANDKASKRAVLHGANTNFTGKIIFERDGKLGFTDESALGPNPPTYTFDQLSIAGGWLLFTNSIAIDDPNRGIQLRAATAYDLRGGGVEVAANAIVTIGCLINGPGNFTKVGAGKLVLTTNETYTGDTYVLAGELNLAPGASLASTNIVINGASAVYSASGTCNTVTLQAGGSLRALGSEGLQVEHLRFDGGGIGIDPTVDDAATPRVTLSGTMTIAPYFPIMVNVLQLDTLPREYKILDAAELANVQQSELYVNPPWAGSLAIQDNGTGGKVLVLTTRRAEEIAYLSSSDAMNHSAFLEPNWSDNSAPAAGKIYVNNRYSLRTPQNVSNTFAGDRLVLDGAGLSMKGKEVMPTVNDCVVMNNSSMGLLEEPTGQLSGNVTLYPVVAANRQYALRIYGYTPLRSFHMFANLHGYGELRLSSDGNPAAGTAAYTLRAMNTNFYGRVRLDGHTSFSLRLTCEENLGGEPPAFRADQLVFNGGGLSVTNDVTLDDVNRGIRLMDQGGISATTGDKGGYPEGTPEKDRTYKGGAIFTADAGHTLSIHCPITGPGSLTKEGAGTVVLAGANSYTGLTEIAQGALAAGSAAAFGSGPVRVKGEGRLLHLCSGSILPNGVELGDKIEFIDGGAVRVAMAEGVKQPPWRFTVPLFLLAAGESMTAEEVPLEHTLTHVDAQVVLSTVGARTLVSAEFLPTGGTLLILR
ncbi:MAG: autotransporter-associated beta strand repeat-containing protein [Kiritimatiellae bacterium]|nr:autotransporter-associated beta strand repeat-containing protein [Kiritimatiellia bacterium]